MLEFGLQVEVLEAPVHRDEQRGQLQLPVLHHQMEQVVGFGVIGDSDVLWGGGGVRVTTERHPFSRLMLYPKSQGKESHHGLVDEASALELDYPEGIRRVGPCVLDHAPFVLRRVDLHQLNGFLHRVGTGRDGHVLRCQLTTGTSWWRTEETFSDPESQEHTPPPFPSPWQEEAKVLTGGCCLVCSWRLRFCFLFLFSRNAGRTL